MYYNAPGHCLERVTSAATADERGVLRPVLDTAPDATPGTRSGAMSGAMSVMATGAPTARTSPRARAKPAVMTRVEVWEEDIYLALQEVVSRATPADVPVARAP